jgi:hypothetical protein
VRGLIPPPFTAPFSPVQDTGIVTLILLWEDWSIKTKNIKERIVVQDVDRCSVRWSVILNLELVMCDRPITWGMVLNTIESQMVLLIHSPIRKGQG